MPRYEIRGAAESDRDALVELAGHLDSVNLPSDSGAIESLVEQSEASFRGTIVDPRRRQYVFVLHDRETGRAVGVSMIVAQLGRPEAPYIFLGVRTDERYSSTLERHFVHTVLDIGYSYDGPTELGGLVVHPAARASADKLGMQISYARFLWIAMRRPNFRDRLLAELLPPLQSDGTSHLWEAVGRQFTGLTYREADRLTLHNKEFVRSLFPDGPIYATLLPEQAQRVIGQVGEQTRGVEKMLRRVGFRYVDRVDPFDGGPHFAAPTDEVTLVARTGEYELTAGRVDGPRRAMLGVGLEHPPWFRAVVTPHAPGPELNRVYVPNEVMEQLDHPKRGWVMPLESRGPAPGS